MKLDKTKYEDDKIDQQKEEEERLLIVMVNNYLYNETIFFCVLHCIDSQRKMPVIPVWSWVQITALYQQSTAAYETF